MVVLLALLFVTSAYSASAEHDDELFPDELVKFTPYPKNPVFVTGGKGAWDELMRERCWIMRDGNQYRMWYTGYMPGGVMRLGHAVSPDGINWQRDSRYPQYGAHWVEDVQVVKQDGFYYLFAEGLNDIAHLFVSGNGISWRREGALDIRNTRGKPISDGPRGTPVGLSKGGQWYLFYERYDKGIWLAASSDMKIWTNLSDDPVLLPGPEAYDDNLIAANQVIEHGGIYYLYYHGKGHKSKAWSVNIAASKNLLEWQKYVGNPLLPAELNLSSGFVVSDGDGFRLYTTHRQVDLFINR
jgi:predicted GH43/DUF377 family glycosyl hydrolase